jgi:hypothetical protein
MFTLAVQRGWMTANPALGIKRAYKSDPNANREWRPEELEAVKSRAPLHLRTAYMIAPRRLPQPEHRPCGVVELST